MNDTAVKTDSAERRRFCVVCARDNLADGFKPMDGNDLEMARRANYLDYMVPLISCERHTQLEIYGAYEGFAWMLMPSVRKVQADDDCPACEGQGIVTSYDSVECWGANVSMPSSEICQCVLRKMPSKFEEGQFVLVASDGKEYQEEI